MVILMPKQDTSEKRAPLFQAFLVRLGPPGPRKATMQPPNGVSLLNGLLVLLYDLNDLMAQDHGLLMPLDEKDSEASTLLPEGGSVNKMMWTAG